MSKACHTEWNESRGYDAGKKTNECKPSFGRGHHGLVLMVLVTTGNIQDRDAAPALLTALFQSFGTIRLVWADSGYAGQLVDWMSRQFRRCLVIVRREAEVRDFRVQPKRWIVERTF